jgi:hypothetical protein
MLAVLHHKTGCFGKHFKFGVQEQNMGIKCLDDLGKSDGKQPKESHPTMYAR